MKKSLKIFSILVISIMLLTISTPVFANKINPGDIINTVNKEINTTGNDDIAERVGKIIGFLQWAGIIAGVVIIAIFGIKYMMGSLEEKAEYKKNFVPFIVGAVVLIAAPQIAKLIFNIFT